MENIFFNNSLSLKEKGLWYMLAIANGWGDYPTMEEFVKYSSDGRSAISTAMNGLIEKGFVEKEVIRENGRIAGVRYKIKEVLNE